ncbi:chromatin-binding/pre-rRNA-processing protein IPI3 SCDLUD_002973 [Saccharomycodes ludwigii]|uniref:chromatin-binding/pre-rRNA-processing protein IPI3 n=1 Tax=Saccharomycodes ludwigii TaxID=36035 RepID=UPI001E836D24|nr:hypothetical protein SCDLUD_002973 [Saccharomycodes ludwigii]KAH3901478.1 hypothetical protein SCDLUD_002973 [Saccharomycodes ludwigii]
MEEEIIFSTKTAITHSYLHSTLDQFQYKQSTTSTFNSIALIEAPGSHKSNYLFVNQPGKAVINVYNIKKEGVEQRLPVVDAMECTCILTKSYKLITSSKTALYIWDLANGLLLNCIKLAHYQKINKIIPFQNEKYIVTCSEDSTLKVWEVSELLRADAYDNDKVKCYWMSKDHNLGITDVVVIGDSNVFTSSKDQTIRCYKWEKILEIDDRATNSDTNRFGLSLKLTYSCSKPVYSIIVDSAIRCIYAGMLDEVISIPVIYKLEGDSVNNGVTKYVNLLNSNNNAPSTQNVYSCIAPSSIKSLKTSDILQKFQMNQVIVGMVIHGVKADKLNINMDCTILLVGDSNTGKLICLDTYSKQVLKEINSGGNINEFTNIIIKPVVKAANLGNTSTSNNGHDNWKFPNLQRSVATSNDNHDLIWKNNTLGSKEEEYIIDTKKNLLLDDFERYLNDFVRTDEHLFHQLDNVKTHNILQFDHTAPNTNSSKDQEIADLKETVKKLTSAYKDLRELYELPK